MKVTNNYDVGAHGMYLFAVHSQTEGYLTPKGFGGTMSTAKMYKGVTHANKTALKYPEVKDKKIIRFWLRPTEILKLDEQ